MNLIGYVRVSTEDQAENGASMAAQRATLRRWAKNHGHEIVTMLDDDISGSVQMEDRPGGKEMLRLLAEGVDGMVSVTQDRIYRDEVGWALFYVGMRKYGKAIFIMDRGEAPLGTNASDEITAGMYSLFSAYHRKQIGEHTKRALRNLRQEGKKWARHVPMTAELRPDGTVGPNLAMIRIAQEARRQRQNGVKLDDIGKWLSTVAPERNWYRTTVDRLIRQADGHLSVPPGYAEIRKRGPKPRSAVESVLHGVPKKASAASRKSAPST